MAGGGWWVGGGGGGGGSNGSSKRSTKFGHIEPPIQWVLGALSLWLKRPGREADHSPPFSAEVKQCVELYLYSQYAFMAWWSCLKKAQGRLYLYRNHLQAPPPNLFPLILSYRTTIIKHHYTRKILQVSVTYFNRREENHCNILNWICCDVMSYNYTGKICLPKMSVRTTMILLLEF
jgi:hypothetical protein